MRKLAQAIALVLVMVFVAPTPADALTWKTSDSHTNCSTRSYQHDYPSSYYMNDGLGKRHYVTPLWIDRSKWWNFDCEFIITFQLWNVKTRRWEWAGSKFVRN